MDLIDTEVVGQAADCTRWLEHARPDRFRPV